MLLGAMGPVWMVLSRDTACGRDLGSSCSMGRGMFHFGESES